MASAGRVSEALAKCDILAAFCHYFSHYFFNDDFPLIAKFVSLNLQISFNIFINHYTKNVFYLFLVGFVSSLAFFGVDSAQNSKKWVISFSYYYYTS